VLSVEWRQRDVRGLRARPVIARQPIEDALRAVTQLVKDFSMLVGESTVEGECGSEQPVLSG
jgi:hypothetical protein